MEKRLKALETTVEKYGRRHDDCEKERVIIEQRLADILSWKAAIQDATEVSQKLVEVGENLLVATRWIGIAAKWVITIGGAFVVFYNGFKWLWEKFHG